MKLRRCR